MPNWEKTFLVDITYTDTVTLAGDNYYLAADAGVVQAYNETDGTVEWSNNDMPNSDGVNGLSVSRDDDTALLTDSEVYFIAPSTGNTTATSNIHVSGEPRDVVTTSIDEAYVAVGDEVVRVVGDNTFEPTPINIGSQIHSLDGDPSNGRIWAGDENGTLHEIDTSNDSATGFTQSPHNSKIVDIHRSSGDAMIVACENGEVSMDDFMSDSLGGGYSKQATVRVEDTPGGVYTDESRSTTYGVIAISERVQVFSWASTPGVEVSTGVSALDVASSGGEYGVGLAGGESGDTDPVSYREYTLSEMSSSPERTGGTLITAQSSANNGVSSLSLNSEQFDSTATIEFPDVSLYLNSTQAAATSSMGDTSLLFLVDAVQPASAATMGTPQLFNVEHLTSSQVVGTASMSDTELDIFIDAILQSAAASANDGTVTSYNVVSAQIAPDVEMADTTSSLDIAAVLTASAASMNDAGPFVFDELTAGQVASTASMLSGGTSSQTQSWSITDASGNTYIANRIALDDGVPQFRRGRELTRTFLFDVDTAARTHKSEYDEVKSKFNTYLTEDATKLITTYAGETHFTQNISPAADVESFVWRVEPNFQTSSDGWWVLVTSIEDTTRMVGPSESLSVTMVPIAPTSEGDRAYVSDEFEV